MQPKVQPSVSDPVAAPATARSPVVHESPRGRCRFCGAALRDTFVDLGMSPLCESYVAADALDNMEPFYPLHVRVCRECLLVQLPAYVAPDEIFREYAYFAAYSDSWVEHARRFVEMAVSRFGLGAASFVVELASNDGYLLQHLVARGVPVLGVEPARNVAAAAEARGVPTVTEFFGLALADQLLRERGAADLLIANNVLAQVPDLDDFVAGITRLLAPDGTASLEFPHLARLIAGVQFDTIYHEHFSYFSLGTTARIAAAHGLQVVDVEELTTHGGSLRVYLAHAGVERSPSPAVARVLAAEAAAGLDRLDGYLGFEEQVRGVRHALLEFLIAERRAGRQVAGYGAPGKGNTLLNYCGIRTDLLAYTVDRNPYKQGRFTPGTHIPILAPARIAETRPDTILILPWNLRDEIVSALEYTAAWGARLAVSDPDRDRGEGLTR